MLRRPWSQRPNGIATTTAVRAGRAVSRPIALPEAPSRRRNTGRNGPEAVTTPMKTESIWTRRQLWARTDGCGAARPATGPAALPAALPAATSPPIGTTLARRPPAAPRIPDHWSPHAPAEPANPVHLRRLRGRVPPRRCRPAAPPAAARQVRAGGRGARHGRDRGRRRDGAARPPAEPGRDRGRAVGAGQPAGALPGALAARG